MSSSSGSTFGQADYGSSSHCCAGWGGNGNWSGLNIAAMVLGFVVFWPIGLLILYWNIKGRSVKDLPKSIGQQWSKMTGGFRRHDGRNHGDHGGNAVFNEFQQTQYDRIREIKDEIRERSHRFSEFRANAKRRADEEEFNRFMNEAPAPKDS